MKTNTIKIEKSNDNVMTAIFLAVLGSFVAGSAVMASIFLGL